MKSNKKSEYGELITKIIKDKNMTQAEFYNKLGIKKPYFYDIIGGKINPPPSEIQIKILKILKPKEEERRKLLDIAARERKEIPADIMMYIENNTNLLSNIRNDLNYKKFFEKIINKGENGYE